MLKAILLSHLDSHLDQAVPEIQDALKEVFQESADNLKVAPENLVLRLSKHGSMARGQFVNMKTKRPLTNFDAGKMIEAPFMARLEQDEKIAAFMKPYLQNTSAADYIALGLEGIEVLVKLEQGEPKFYKKKVGEKKLTTTDLRTFLSLMVDKL